MKRDVYDIMYGMDLLLKEWEDAFENGFPDGINSTRLIISGSFMQLAREAREVLKLPLIYKGDVMTEKQVLDDIERFVSDDGLEIPTPPRKVYTEQGYYEEAAKAMREDDIRRAEIFNRAFKPKVVK